MSFNEGLINRVREALAHLPEVEEKKMFRGITFMVNGKMCISVRKDGIMCRIDPAIHQKAIQRKAAETMVMKGREYIGYVNIYEEGLKNKSDFDYWIMLALDFNKLAKAAKKKK